MMVRSILEQKGRDVETIGPDATLAEAAAMLAEKRIGAAIVLKSGTKIAGILSERDIVRAIGEGGADALDARVTDTMTQKVKTCSEDNTVNEVMEIMTTGRFRHLPVVKDGNLVGIISIGDVVKRRIEEIEREAEDIRSYIATA